MFLLLCDLSSSCSSSYLGLICSASLRRAELWLDYAPGAFRTPLRALPRLGTTGRGFLNFETASPLTFLVSLLADPAVFKDPLDCYLVPAPRLEYKLHRHKGESLTRGPQRSQRGRRPSQVPVSRGPRGWRLTRCGGRMRNCQGHLRPSTLRNGIRP